MERRLQNICSHITASPILSIAPQSTAANEDDVVIVCAVRTAIAKGKRGAFRESSPDKLLTPLLKHVIEKTGIDPKILGDVVIGTVLPPGGQGATEVRVAMLLAGIPKEVPCTTVNRQCSSGLQAIVNAAAAIKANLYDAALAGGVESMSTFPMGRWEGSPNEMALTHSLASGCYVPMGITSENIAERFNISRKQQDEFSVESHNRAAAAIKSGKFKAEIVPITVKVDDKEVVVSQDEGVRAGTTVEGLSKLRPAFKEDGSTTAGNSSQVSDGAAVSLVCRRSYAKKLGLPVLGVLRSYAVVGVDPAIMGIGPAAAIPEAVRKAGLTLGDIDIYEINEAFASQATYCIKKLGLDLSKVNPNGGAIALGHPLGCTGARMTATLLHELHRQKKRYGVVSMCIGSGMGAAAVYEVEH